jgi:hypothetical protein
MTGNPGGPIKLAENRSQRSHAHGRRQNDSPGRHAARLRWSKPVVQVILNESDGRFSTKPSTSPPSATSSPISARQSCKGSCNEREACAIGRMGKLD